MVFKLSIRYDRMNSVCIVLMYVLFYTAAVGVYAKLFLWNGFDYFSFIGSLCPSVCSTSKLMFKYILYFISHNLSCFITGVLYIIGRNAGDLTE